MRSVGEGFELILVTILAGIAADIVCGVVARCLNLGRLDGLGGGSSAEPRDSSNQ
jgi:hypothetical protein